MRTAILPCGLVVALGLLVACDGGGGDDRGCHDPSCVRDVTVTRLETVWAEDGTSSTAPAWDIENVALDALVVNGQTGETRTIAAERDGSSWVLRGVPGGPYRLRMTTATGAQQLFDTSASDVDLGFDTAGRADFVVPSAPTVATLQVAGLSPWTTVDHLQLVSWNAGLFNEVDPAVEVAATGANVAYDFAGSGWYGSDPLLVTTDRLHALQLRAYGNAAGGWAAPVAAGSATGIFMVDGNPASIPLVMSPVYPDRQASVDWRATRFEAHRAAMGAGATTASYPHWMYVMAAPLPAGLSASVGAGAAPFQVWVRPGADARLGTIAYASVAPSKAYRERATVSYHAEVARAAPGAAAVRFDVTIGREDPSVPAPIAPVLSPPRAVRVAGRDASTPQAGVGTAPVLAWVPPEVGHADSYVVQVVELYDDAGQTRRRTAMTLRTAATETALPPGALISGRTYVLVIDARDGSFTPEAPYRRTVPAGWARTVTETFSP